jgi:3-methyladenine DNA glycosylase/8-oxoguanine DNA glycosylase
MPEQTPGNLVQDIVRPTGLYRLSLMAGARPWRSTQPAGGEAVAWQERDGRVVVRARDEAGLELARFQLALADDTAPFHARFDRDPLLGPSARALRGFRPLRTSTVTLSAVQAFCGQLVQSSQARDLERAALREAGTRAPLPPDIGRLTPARLARLGLAQRRATALVSLCRGLDLERLRNLPLAAVEARLLRSPQVGPWTVGVIATNGLGSFERGIVGDLGLVKLASSLWGRAAEPEETAELLAPFAEWQGLACALLLRGFKRGLVPGANKDHALQIRQRARRAA